MIYLAQSNPEPMSLAFVMYEDGVVIYPTKWKEGGNDGDHGFMTVRLTKGERKALLETINISTFEKLKGYYEATDAWDCPITQICVRTRTGLKSVDVYGVDHWIDPRIQGKQAHEQSLDAKVRDHTPKAFLKVFDVLTSYRHPRAERWIPETIDVVLWPTNRNSVATEWPKEWPNLKHPEVRAKKVAGRLLYYLVPLSRKHWKRIQALSREKATVRINGDLYQVGHRFRFSRDIKNAKKQSGNRGN